MNVRSASIAAPISSLWRMSPAHVGGLDEVVHERVDPLGAGLAEQRDLGDRQVAADEEPVPHRVVDVVVDVRDTVDDAHDLPFERLGLGRPGVVEDPVAHLRGQVQPLSVLFEHVDDPERVLVVAEPAPESLLQLPVECRLACVPERRVPEVVAEPDRLDEVLVQPERAGDAARDARRLERVRHPGAEVVAAGVDEDLRLALQPAERLRVDDPVAVALERRPQPARFLLARPSACLVGAHRER